MSWAFDSIVVCVPFDEQYPLSVMTRLITVSEKISGGKGTPNEKPVSQSEHWVWRIFKEFASSTALHGYNHIVREDTARWERFA